MRITQSMMYDGFLKNMQTCLSDYMESNIQGSSQKKINRPSDDPAGMALVLNSRRNIDNTVQYQRNVDTAQGWLNLADSTLIQVSTTITSIKTLAEQAATGTMTADNRLQVAMQIKQLFGQLINLSNKQFEGKSIFAGHKYDNTAYEEGLSVNTMDPNLQNTQFAVTGKSDHSIMLVFEDAGTIGGTAPIDYRWSKDGGTTWTPGQLTLPPLPEPQFIKNIITMDGVTLTIPNGTPVKAEDPTQDVGAKNGTVLYIRPTAIYQGDVQGAEPYATMRSGTLPVGATMKVQGNFSQNVLVAFEQTTDLYGTGDAEYRYSLDNGNSWIPTPPALPATVQIPNPPGKLTIPISGLPAPYGGSIEFTITPTNSTILAGTTIDVQPRRIDVMGGQTGLTVNAQGTFNKNVLVNIDKVNGANMEYSYSTDYGQTWLPASTQVNTGGVNNARLPVPGGYIDLTANTPFTAGTQFVIHPDRADLNYEIMKDTYLPVNSVGKNIFGGIYNGMTVQPAEQNLFDIVGKLIAYTENNNQEGVQQCLDALTKAQEKVLTEAARIGGLENRLTLAKDVLSFEKLDMEERLSYTEDVDLTELLTRMAKQELAYNTVLKSTSMIMQLNLTKFV